MREILEDIELPEGWEAEKEYLNGNNKLVANYRNLHTGEKVSITPYKTYSLPGFCNSHRVVYSEHGGSRETVEKGLSRTEHPGEAKEVAVETMTEVAK